MKNTNEVTIGTQVWMAENLNVSTFRNGDPIPEAKTDKEWEKAGEEGKPAWCYYNNDPANGDKYGKLYNGYAVNDPRGLAPEGLHMPSGDEWTILTDYLGGKQIAGTKMKTKTDWKQDGNGTNSSRFSGLPGANRIGDGRFDGVGAYGCWWSAMEDTVSTSTWYRSLFYANGNLSSARPIMTTGLSVRCLRD